ncbi:hypothetical protein NM208_g7499 [Fusarium decemcellulare]|uniref:Uncharacterized protein n=1 Tax=Fusarium decemcellulare TaxID=57161 RepID=A0ACC1S934_9HYPO|nr:hypothetical protein NM208_g7499 [Fusarium decemcellulare]
MILTRRDTTSSPAATDKESTSDIDMPDADDSLELLNGGGKASRGALFTIHPTANSMILGVPAPGLQSGSPALVDSTTFRTETLTGTTSQRAKRIAPEDLRRNYTTELFYGKHSLPTHRMLSVCAKESPHKSLVLVAERKTTAFGSFLALNLLPPKKPSNINAGQHYSRI